jgi:hypothetical protein
MVHYTPEIDTSHHAAADPDWEDFLYGYCLGFGTATFIYCVLKFAGVEM